jgi:hypothetical protein
MKQWVPFLEGNLIDMRCSFVPKTKKNGAKKRTKKGRKKHHNSLNVDDKAAANMHIARKVNVKTVVRREVKNNRFGICSAKFYFDILQN